METVYKDLEASMLKVEKELTEENYFLKMALDKACMQLELFDSNYSDSWDRQQWQEWCFNNDK